MASSAGTNSITNHLRSYRSALKSNLEITIHSLKPSYIRTKSLLHPLASDPTEVDFSALIYCLNRLPQVAAEISKIILGQSPEIYADAGYPNLASWQIVRAKSRRRVAYFHPKSKILAYLISSVSDIDDLVNILIAFQIEWNKFNHLLHKYYSSLPLFIKNINTPTFLNKFKLSSDVWEKFFTSLGPDWKQKLQQIYQSSLDLKIQLLSASWLNYTKTTQRWWKNIAATVSPSFHISRQEIYFVSSNTHSLINAITGFPTTHQSQIINFIHRHHPRLYHHWQKILDTDTRLNPTDFLYYASRYLLHQPKYQSAYQKLQHQLGIITIPNQEYLDITVQVIPVKNIVSSPHLDPRLKITRPAQLKKSSALIFNIDYPLGFAAYHILAEVMQNVRHVKGIYILGKAATLNSEIGDIQIPRLVFDEHTQNSYLFKNCFNSFFPFVNHQGSILTNQRAVSVLGTFLQNRALVNFYLKNNITVIEMESGPYLSAITEGTYDQQASKNTIIDLNSAPYDIGIINYTSDTPFSSVQNLGDSNLGISGIEPVTLGSLAILQRIINLEQAK
jgi:hypothetical protein